jgi:hypothetical protein
MLSQKKDLKIVNKNYLTFNCTKPDLTRYEICPKDIFM